MMLHFYLSSSPLHLFLALTFGQYIPFENACELQRVVLHLEGVLYGKGFLLDCLRTSPCTKKKKEKKCGEM